jgi:hypothetical protein
MTPSSVSSVVALAARFVLAATDGVCLQEARRRLYRRSLLG